MVELVGELELGYVDWRQPDDLTTLPVFNLANWDYEECGTGLNPFGADWELSGNFKADWQEGPGPGYAFKYVEMWERRDWSQDGLFIDAIVLQWHFAEADNWDDIVCVDSSPQFPPDPGVPGKLSPPQPGWAAIYVAPTNRRLARALKLDNNAEELPDDTYDPGIDAIGWANALAPGANVLYPGSTGNGGAESEWRNGSSRGGEWEFAINHRARYEGVKTRVRVNDTYPNTSAVGEEDNFFSRFQNLNLQFGEDYTRFPGTHLSTYEVTMWNGYPIVLDAGLTCIVQVRADINHHDESVNYPFSFTQRLTFPDDFPLTSSPTSTTKDYFPSPSGPNQIDLIWQVQGDNDFPGYMTPDSEELIGGDTHLVRQNEIIDGFRHLTVSVSHWADQLNDMTNDVLSWFEPAFMLFTDPHYFAGALPPWGGHQTSFFSSHHHGAWVRMSSVKPFIEVQWPEWHYWIPGEEEEEEECPPHLRLLQRSDVAKGPFEPIPVTPECGKALRLMGRDVQQNLIPGNLPRVQPNSYP